MRSRAEHLEWCKVRALEYLPDTAQAMTSLASDLRKHPDTRDHQVVKLMWKMTLSGLMNVRECRDLIEGTQ